MKQIQSTNSKTIAFFEVIVVCSLYIALSNLAVSNDVLGASQWYPGFTEIQSKVASGFTTGAIVQCMLVIVLLAIPFFPDIRRAVATLRQPAAINGWRIALIILIIEVIVLYLGWIKEFDRLLDSSTFGISMSIVPSFDGISQEIIFRGYVLLRLARCEVSRTWQIVVSGLLFAAIHIPYTADSSLDMSIWISHSLMPLAGTFSLGAAWAFAFQQSKYRLMPVMVSHVLVIALVQPWLALVYSIS